LASEALPVLLFILSILVLTFASAIFILEPRDNIGTLPESLWLTIVTVGTIGYGDIVPTSAAGSMVVSLLVIVSSLYMAIPIGIVGRAFSTVWDDRDRLLLMYRTRRRFLDNGFKPKDVPALFYNFDVDSDGQLSFNEFSDMMVQLQIDLSADRLMELFQTFDQDGSGSINDEEFVKTLFPETCGCVLCRWRRSPSGAAIRETVRARRWRRSRLGWRPFRSSEWATKPFISCDS